VYEHIDFSGRKTVKTVSDSGLSLFTAINRGVNEKITLDHLLNRPVYPSANRYNGIALKGRHSTAQSNGLGRQTTVGLRMN
jgi:hypothetical protein